MTQEKYAKHKRLLRDLKFGVTLLTLYTLASTKDLVCATNEKRKSVMSFCREVKEVLFTEHVDTYPNRKDNMS